MVTVARGLWCPAITQGTVLSTTDLGVVNLVCSHFVDLDVFNKGDAPLLKTHGNITESGQIMKPQVPPGPPA